MKIYNIRYRISSIIAVLLISVSGFAQSARSTYFMETSYTRTDMNPALRPDQGYIGIPFLSNVNLSARTNTFNLDNLTFPMNGERVTFMYAGIPADQALSNISSKNYIASELSLDVFSMGFFRGDSYWKVDLRARTVTDLNTPKAMFELLKVGFDENGTITHDISNTNLYEQTFTEIGATNSRKFLDNSLTLGARAKLILGFSYIDMNAVSMEVAAGPEYWRAKSQATLTAAGPGISPRYTTDENNPNGKPYFDGFDYGGFSIPGLGLGVDLGAEYDFKQNDIDLLKGLKVSYALNDIGFIRWNNKNSVQLQSPETEVIINPNDYSVHSDGSTSINDVFNNAVDDIKQAINFQEVGNNKGFTTPLRVTMNLGAEYEVWKNKMTAGLLYSKRYSKYFNTSELTLSANYKPTSWFASTLSYSFLYSGFKTFGLALQFAPQKGVNFFIASDYVITRVSSQWLPTRTKALNAQIGIAIPIGSKRH